MGLLGMFGKKNIETTKAVQRHSAGDLKADAPKKSVKEKVLAEKDEKQERRVAIAQTEGFSNVLLGARITEKASMLSEHSPVYTFNVSAGANKNTVSEAVSRLYKVHPVRVRLVNVPSKRVFVRGKRGVKRGGRKAYVCLKEGEKIEIA